MRPTSVRRVVAHLPPVRGRRWRTRPSCGTVGARQPTRDPGRRNVGNALVPSTFLVLFFGFFFFFLIRSDTARIVLLSRVTCKHVVYTPTETNRRILPRFRAPASGSKTTDAGGTSRWRFPPSRPPRCIRVVTEHGPQFARSVTPTGPEPRKKMTYKTI